MIDHDKKSRRGLFLLLAVTVGFAVLLVTSHQKTVYPEIGKVVFLEEERIPQNKYSFQTVSDGTIVCLYYDSLGLVNVYSSGGGFLYGIEVGHLRNGKGAIALENGLLYVKARGNVIYVFDGMKLIDWAEFSFDSSTEEKEYYRHYEEQMN